MNMGIIAYQLQAYDEAAVRLEAAAAVFAAIGSRHWLASTQNELGLVYRDQGRWDEALACFARYIEQRRAEGAQDQIGRGLNNQGEVLLFQGRLASARAALQGALDKMTTRVYRIDTYLHLGLAYQAAGQLAPAESAFRDALALAQEIGRREILPHVHYRLGDALRRQGKDDAALAEFSAAAEIIEATRAPLRDEALKITLLGRWQQIYEMLVLHCLALGRPADAFDWAERARARAFAEGMAGGAMITAGAETVRAALPDGSALLCYFTTGVLQRDIPLVRAIAADNPLREHLLTPARTLLFVLTPATLTVHHCPLDPNLLTTVSPRGADPDRFLVPAVQQRLKTALLAEAGDGASRLWLIPHGPLHHVPFGAFLGGDEKALPVYAPSATLLQHSLSTRPPAGATGCLALGYRGEGDGRVLQYAEIEAESVAALAGGTAWVGPAAEGVDWRETAAGARRLHFACHGWFNYEHPLDSYLEIGAGERLTAQEVMAGWRLTAELVTLSACETGVSRILRGDEPMGLVRAFLVAGARSVLVSLWPVEDLATLLLMSRFYRELEAAGGTEVAVALHKAQRWLRALTVGGARRWLASLPQASELNLPVALRDENYPFAHPRHWAAFVLVGTG